MQADRELEIRFITQPTHSSAFPRHVSSESLQEPVPLKQWAQVKPGAPRVVTIAIRPCQQARNGGDNTIDSYF